MAVMTLRPAALRTALSATPAGTATPTPTASDDERLFLADVVSAASAFRSRSLSHSYTPSLSYPHTHSLSHAPFSAVRTPITPQHFIFTPAPPPPTPATTESMLARSQMLNFIRDEVSRIPHEESFLSFTPSTVAGSPLGTSASRTGVVLDPDADALTWPTASSLCAPYPYPTRAAGANPVLYTGGMLSLSTNTTGTRKAPPPPLESLKPRPAGSNPGNNPPNGEARSNSSWEEIASEDTINSIRSMTPTLVGLKNTSEVSLAKERYSAVAIQRRNSLLRRLKRFAPGKKDARTLCP